MKVTGLTSYLAAGTCYVKVETDEGIRGFGECSRKGGELILPILRKVIGPQLMGTSPFNLETLEENVLRKHYKLSGQLLAMAYSGVEMALWDVMGKALRQPVYNLLGGLYRDKVKLYGSSMSRNLGPEAEAAKVKQGIDQYGFQAVKMKIGPRYGTGGKVDLEEDVHRVRIMRETIGPDVKLMLDGNSSYTVAQAVQLFEKIRGFDIHHYEEPCPYYDLEAYKKLAALPVPIHVGEQDWNLFTFRDFVARGACDLYAVDPVKCGGIANAKRAAVLCRAFGITYAPHNTTRGVGLAAALHLSASSPESDYYLEYKLGEDPSEAYLTRPFPVLNGEMEIPSGHGLGVQLDEEKMERTMEVVQY